jgi:hypothetical protein
MPTVHLKTGEVVEVPLEEIANYLRENEDNILVRRVKRRGPVRGKIAPAISTISNSKF